MKCFGAMRVQVIRSFEVEDMKNSASPFLDEE